MQRNLLGARSACKYEKLKTIADREKAPCYKVGKIKNDEKFQIKSKKNNTSPINLSLSDFFGSSPKTVMRDDTINKVYPDKSYSTDLFEAFFRVFHFKIDRLNIISRMKMTWQSKAGGQRLFTSTSLCF